MKWFDLKFKRPELNEDPEALEWLEMIKAKILEECRDHLLEVVCTTPTMGE